MADVTVALIGTDSLLGREIRDIVATSAPELKLRLIAADEERAGTLTRMGDEPTLLTGLEAAALDDLDAVILAGSRESATKTLELLADHSPAVIDLTGTAEDHPSARLRAPMVEPNGERETFGERPAKTIHVIAHPAAIALALFLRRLHAHDAIRRSVIEIMAPASEYGTAGVEELQQQTINLLSFKGLPKAIFDAQAAFNMLPRYGEKAPVPLEELELRIERHLATLLALEGNDEEEEAAAPMPSLRLIQAPVFHGYSFSAWVEFESNPGIEALESGLVSGPIEVRGGEFEPPTNVGQAGVGGIAIGGITPDRNNPEAVWFWGVADNLRLSAENAVAVARELG